MKGSEENRRTIKPKIAGILLILAGFIGLVSWSQFVFTNESLLEIVSETIPSQITQEQLKMILSVCGTVGIVISIFPIVGGIFSYKYKSWILPVISSIIGLFIIGLGLLSTVFSIISLIILMVSKDEFR